MPPKYATKRKLYRKYSKNVPKGKSVAGTLNASASRIQSAVRRVLAKKVETKRATFSVTDGQEIFHNNFISLTPNILATTQGVQDPTTTNQDCRIGDEILLKGASLKMMIELNERYSDVTIRLIVVRAAKGDTPTRATLFTGRSGNKMLDNIDYERYSVLFQKYYKLKSPNMSISSPSGGTTEVATTVPPSNAGIEWSAADRNMISRATKIIKVWIPGYRFSKYGKIRYENASSQVKFFDYHVLVYAYSNITTAQDLWYVARINDYVQEIYYKDP